MLSPNPPDGKPARRGWLCACMTDGPFLPSAGRRILGTEQIIGCSMPARSATLWRRLTVWPRRFGSAPMLRAIFVWALVLAAGAFVLQWLQYEYLVRMFSREVYIGIIGTAFAAGGVWLGWKLAARTGPNAFTRNEAAMGSLGLTGQEIRVLEALASGHSNKEIANTLGLSPNTVKTHTANLYAKLGVSSRTRAVNAARELHILP